MSFDVYRKLFDTTVWPVISYGAAIWRTREYTVQSRRFFGVGKPLMSLMGTWDGYRHTSNS